MNKTVIITGGSSGIGKATAQLFANQGYRVYELSRRDVNPNDNPNQEQGTITHIKCDVTNPEACRQAVAQMDLTSLEGGLILISNAGMGISGAVEFTKPEDARRQMDVNFMGAVNITQAVLPVMRQQRLGTIIYVSSVMGQYGLPFQAFYSASKFAINGFAQALTNEVRPFGIKVAVLMPGDVKTGFTDARKKELLGADTYPHMQKAVATMEHDEQHGIAPERMAKKLLALAESKNPEPTSTVGLMYKVFLFLGRVFPQRLINYVIGKMY
ncbi:MAG: SDR family oxidoreductase [Prevotella sp.]|nr:SDR family oxidoreductase [Prevotella sp.]